MTMLKRISKPPTSTFRFGWAGGRGETIGSLFFQSLRFQIGCLGVARLLKQLCFRHYSCLHRRAILNAEECVVRIDTLFRLSGYLPSL
ncbi:hypothetical protein ABIE41_001337 [Bosea sp. OAE506]|uniref:hypothetical protein n=1 Tax=Bosea sp. OAE506 TaxID=2663870 RepID=UPI001788F559